MAGIRDLTGKRFGKLLVIKDSGTKKWGNIVWECLCDCGKKTSVKSSKLKQGYTKSCGCLKGNLFQVTHGLRTNKIYNIWASMKARCLNPKEQAYFNYGGRGIKVCDRWLKFDNFYEDMKLNYNNKLTLDRINNNKGYYKENCRWADRETQANNARSNHLITYRGETKTLAQWANKVGLKYKTLFSRLTQSKWPINKALNYLNI